MPENYYYTGLTKFQKISTSQIKQNGRKPTSQIKKKFHKTWAEQMSEH